MNQTKTCGCIYDEFGEGLLYACAVHMPPPATSHSNGVWIVDFGIGNLKAQVEALKSEKEAAISYLGITGRKIDELTADLSRVSKYAEDCEGECKALRTERDTARTELAQAREAMTNALDWWRRGYPQAMRDEIKKALKGA